MTDFNEGFKERSVNIEEISEKELKFGYWFLTHKEQIKKAIIISLIVFSVFTYGYAIFGVGRFYIFQYEEFQNSLLITSGADFVNIAGVHASNAISPLQIISRQIVQAGDGKVDIAIRVRNPNVKWTLDSVVFQISHGGKFFDAQSSFVLPGEEKYLLLLNVEGARSGTPQVFFQDENWRRVTQYDAWSPSRLNFLVTNKRFISARQGEISEQLPVSEAQAEITNASAYNFNEVEVQIALLSGTRLVGVSSVVVQGFSSGDKKPIVTRWVQSLPAVSTVEIIPTVNILKDSVYQDFQGEFDPSYFEPEERRYF